MEEKKGRGVFFGQPVRILTIVVTLLSVMIFSGCAAMLITLSANGMDLDQVLSRPTEKSYETTQQFGYNVVEYMSRVSQVVGYGKPFLTDGELDLKKTVDITDLEAASGDQSEDTSYTVKTLREMADREGEFSELIYSAENMAYTYDEGASASEASEDSGYSEKFVYLYENGRTLERECGLPASGVSLADYARENSDTVSLLDLYKSLDDALSQMGSYMGMAEILGEQQTNLRYYVEDLDTNAIYTNVEKWRNGYVEDPALAENSGDFAFTGIRNGGTLESEADTDAEEYLREIYASSPVAAENERIVLLVDTSYPVYDQIASSAAFYERYAAWGNIFVIGLLASFLTGILGTVLLTVQTGRVREDRRLHLRGTDKLPTEVVAAVAGVALFVMIGMGIAAGSTGTTDYWTVLIPLILMELGAAVVFFWFYTSLVRRAKGKLLWKSSLSYNILVSCKKVYSARTTSGQMITAFILLMLGNMFVLLTFGGFGVFLALIADGIVLLYLIKEGAGRQVIRNGLARIAGGELDFKIDEKDLTGDNREMAEAVNHVGDGLKRAVQETVKSERLKADLITNVSHDIKTPLTSIINYVDLLKRENIEDPKIKGYIEVLDSKSQRLKQLTEDLVEASKISSGNIVLDMRPINLGELVWQTNGEFEEKFNARGLEIVSKIPDHPVKIMADGRRMWRVVENLYNNVAKYAMPHTRVYVAVRQIGCRVIFELKNISENSLNSVNPEELTGRFVRGDVSRSTEGSGLGLSIAKNLVKLQKGTFDIYLDGDLFKVTITFAAADQEPQQAETADKKR